jgi:hypothetical protein
VGGDGPTADFDISTRETSPNQAIEFDASASEIPAGDSATYEWEYETGGYSNGTSSGQSFSHAFSDYGEFGVTLTVTDEYDRSSSLTRTVEVTGEGPTADFEYSPSDPGVDDRIVFDGSVSTAPDLTIESYRWFVNGEPQGSGSETSGSFDEADVYTVELEVENTGGKSDRVSKTIPVGDEEDIIDNPDFELARTSPETASTVVKTDEAVSFRSEIESEEIPEATQSLFIDGVVVNQSSVRSRNLRLLHRFDELGEHTVEFEVQGAAGKSDVVQWDVITHNFNLFPTVSDQSSSTVVDVDSNTEILTFSIRNPESNTKTINTEIVAELPDGISISGASGVSSGDAAVQAANKTIAPGQQESMRLNINVEDNSLDGQQLTIPYSIRYRPVGGENIIYTPDEQSLKISVGGTQDEADDTAVGSSQGEVDDTADDSPGFGLTATVISGLLVIISARIRSSDSKH